MLLDILWLIWAFGALFTGIVLLIVLLRDRKSDWEMDGGWIASAAEEPLTPFSPEIDWGKIDGLLIEADGRLKKADGSLKEADGILRKLERRYPKLI
jgi:hypothetical protein